MADNKVVKFQAGVDLDLFGNQLMGMVDSVNKFMVIKQINTGDDAAVVKVGAFTRELRTFFKEWTGLNLPALPKEIDSLANKVDVSVKQTFMMYRIDTRELDFAFWIAVSAGLKQLGIDFGDTKVPFNINEAYLKLWYTDNEVIKREMQIEDFSRLLESQ